MRALDAGGIPAIYDDSREALMRQCCTMLPGYDPNPHGFFEIDLRNVEWSSSAGKCVKVIYELIPQLPSGTYRCVYMVRDPVEIKRSFVGVMSQTPTRNHFRFLYDYHGQVADDVALLKEKGSEVVALNYSDVVRDPLGELSRLNWPIHAAKAAATVDPSLYRHRGAA